MLHRLRLWQWSALFGAGAALAWLGFSSRDSRDASPSVEAVHGRAEHLSLGGVTSLSPPERDWDERTSEERLRTLEERFDAALAALASNPSHGSRERHEAEAALTAMRAELYSSPDGRARHRDYELKLSRLTEDPQ